ncbi:MAG: DUF5134 domain-containing protein [Streptosporangiaceae bacterium]
MRGPSWLAGILAVIMIATAAYCATRLIIARAHRRPDERDVDLVHTVMGVAMAGMLVSWLNPLPDGVWAVMFGAGTGWFGWRAWRGRRDRAPEPGTGRPPHHHHVPHLVMCGAMVYMLLAAGAATSAAGTGMTIGGPATAGRFPLLALVLAVFMVGYVMWQADRLPALSRASIPRTTPAGTPALAPAPVAAGGGQATQAYEAAPDPPSRQVLSPHLAACCQIAMAVTMGYMLILML